MALSKEEILDAISEMSVIDIVDLISAMEEKFGVSAAAPVAAAAPAAGGGDAGAEEATDDAPVDIHLTDVGDKKVDVIKAVRAITGLGLIDDKAFVVVNAAQINKTLSAFGHEEKMAKKILIVGGGNIGFNLAKILESDSEGVRVKIIEKNKDRAEFIANELNNTIVINGDGLDEDVLKEANIEETETVLSLTNDDENNIMVCVLAEKNSPNKRTIALVNKQNYSLLQSSLKIDDLVDPRLTTISTILKHVHKGTIETVYTLLDGEYEFIEAEVLETSELISKSLKESNLPNEIRIGAVLRSNEIIIPSDNFL